MGPSKDQGLREVEELLRKDIDTNQYDPKQDEDLRRQLRIQYRDLQEQTFGKRKKEKNVSSLECSSNNFIHREET